MTLQDLIDATRQAYLVDQEPPGYDNGCRYRTSSGARCAIGRHIPENAYTELMEGIPASSVAVTYPAMWKAVFGDLNPVDATRVQAAHDCACGNAMDWSLGGTLDLAEFRRLLKDGLDTLEEATP